MNKILFRLNATYKSFITVFKYKLIVLSYKLKPVHKLPKLPSLPSGELNVLFLGSDYVQDMSGMVQGLKKHCKIHFFTKLDGSYGLYPSKSLRDLSVCDLNSSRLKKIVDEMALDGHPPSIIIGQIWGHCFDANLLNEFRAKYQTISISIGMDDRHTFWGGFGKNKSLGTYGLSKYVDLHLSTSPECVSWYHKEGCNAIYFPEASDSTIFKPIANVKKKYDICFVGAKYGFRGELIDYLRSSGLQVNTYGDGWGSKRISIDEMAQIFSESKIILGFGGIGHCKDFYSLKLRDFDAPMSGSFYLTSANKDLKDLYLIGSEIEVYANKSECLKKIKFYLNNDVIREGIALAGHRRASFEHTWDIRFSQLLDIFNA